MTFLDSVDLEWLESEFGIDIEGAVCGILYGNEDAPERVELYTRDVYTDWPLREYATTEDDPYTMQLVG